MGKTDEEIITEQKEMLEKLEELRQNRMKGGDFEDDESGDDAEEEEAVEEQEEEEEEEDDDDNDESQDEYSDLEESDLEDSDKKDKAKLLKLPQQKSKDSTRDKKSEETKQEIPFVFAVPKSSEELESLLQDKSAKVKGVIIQRMIK